MVFWMRGISSEDPMGTLSSATGWGVAIAGARGLAGALRSTFFFGAWMLLGGAAGSVTACETDFMYMQKLVDRLLLLQCVEGV